MFRKKPSPYFQNIHKKITSKSIESEIFELRDMIKLSISNNETQKIKDVMAVIKKVIKQNIEAKYKFYALLLLREIMRKDKKYNCDYFVKKLSDRLIKIAKHQNVKNKTQEIKGATCLNRYFL